MLIKESNITIAKKVVILIQVILKLKLVESV